jgi:hypothetical protein
MTLGAGTIAFSATRFIVENGSDARSVVMQFTALKTLVKFIAVCGVTRIAESTGLETSMPALTIACEVRERRLGSFLRLLPKRCMVRITEGAAVLSAGSVRMCRGLLARLRRESQVPPQATSNEPPEVGVTVRPVALELTVSPAADVNTIADPLRIVRACPFTRLQPTKPFELAG